jgi:hypothetical protein
MQKTDRKGGGPIYLSRVGDGERLDGPVTTSLFDVLHGVDYVHSFDDLV